MIYIMKYHKKSMILRRMYKTSAKTSTLNSYKEIQINPLIFSKPVLPILHARRKNNTSDSYQWNLRETKPYSHTK